MANVKCDKCGKSCTVPFEPDGRRPVYCRECFQKSRTSRPKADPKEFGWKNPQREVKTSPFEKEEEF